MIKLKVLCDFLKYSHKFIFCYTKKCPKLYQVNIIKKIKKECDKSSWKISKSFSKKKEEKKQQNGSER